MGYMAVSQSLQLEGDDLKGIEVRNALEGLPQTGLLQTGLPQTGLLQTGLLQTGLPQLLQTEQRL